MTFFEDSDYARYKELLAEGSKRAGVEVWAYCLMPNHVHLILVPGDKDGLRASLAEAPRRYTRAINERMGWTGYLWQGRFASVAMYDGHLMRCARFTSNRTPCGRDWSNGPATGAGRARGRI